MTKRIPTGIEGLDELMEGGFIPGSIILISGETGAGKTIFGSQFLHHFSSLNRKGLYISLQQPPDEIKKDVERFGFDFEGAEKKGLFKMIYVDLQRLNKLVELIINQVENLEAEALVIDSISMFCEAPDKPIDIRFGLIQLVKQLKKMGLTTLLISEIPEGTNKLSRYGIEEFMADGVIVLRAGIDIVGGKPRSLFIKKMRRTYHDIDVHPIEITGTGLKVVA